MTSKWKFLSILEADGMQGMNPSLEVSMNQHNICQYNSNILNLGISDFVNVYDTMLVPNSRWLLMNFSKHSFIGENRNIYFTFKWERIGNSGSHE